ncbi:MAG: universal stress protein [Bacteroidales bacterium]|jgi:nucleotide-binding universal stress UspA family protein|nr:universal stress protein [Bacteroidales bacterium]
MEMSNNLIVVPFDFTPMSYQAIEHGACLAMAMEKKLLLLHVAGKESEIPALEKKLQIIVDECLETYQLQPEFKIVKGSRPYATIKTAAEELNAALVILKTGGIRGIKRYTGIRTIKILSGSLVPFVVIQDAPKNATLQNIVFPINFLGEHDTKLKRVVFFSRFYPDATMHIITPSGKDTDKEKIIASNIKVMTKALEDQNIKVNFITHDHTKNKAELIIAAAKEANADMIMTPTENVPTAIKFLFGLREEKLISNAEKIPVMCVHASLQFL